MFTRHAFTPLMLLLAALIPTWVGAQSVKSHGVSMFGELKYPADFSHFEYTNPDAPKGGSLRLSVLGSFDEAAAEYGLVAESIEVAEDIAWAIFYMRPQAKWHDGEPLTAHDVAWTFETLTTKGHPVYRAYYRNVERAEVIDQHTVKFAFKETNNSALPLAVGQMPILPKHYYAKVDFEKATLDPPLGSGQYKVVTVDAGRSIVYERVKDYWAEDLPVKRGVDNFQQIRYDYHQDMSVGLEALKAGSIDFRREHISKEWATAYDFPAVEERQVIKEEITDGSMQVFQGWMMNLRKEKYQDIRVRKALGLVFDFEWMNKNLFDSVYKRIDSIYQNSELASSGLPEGGELELLEQYREQLDPEQYYKEALALLKDAGWEVKDGALTNVKSNEKFEIDFITRQPGVEKVAQSYQKSLQQIGIEMNVRVIDSAQWVKLLENFDFDFATIAFAMPLSPGSEQRNYFGSESADREGSRNFAGIKNKVVDALLEKMTEASSRQQQVDAARALDRVIKHSHYFIPQYFGDSYRVAYRNKFSRPEIQAKYELGLNYWWVDPIKEAALAD